MGSIQARAALEDRDLVSHLIMRSAKGDQMAFSRLHALTRGKMRKVALSVLGASDDIDDVLQDAYMKVWRHASRFDPARSSPISWISVIVRNTALDLVRRKKPATTDLDLVLDVIAEEDKQDDFDYAFARKIADNVIAKLPHDRKTLLSLAYVEGHSRKAISNRLGVPISTIKTWLRRTLEGVKIDCAELAKRPALSLAIKG